MMSKSKKYDNTNTGAAWGCEKTCSGHPEMKGSLDVNGKLYYISIWVTPEFKLKKNGEVKKCNKPSLRFEIQKAKK
jgi:hypothetical protein